MKAHTLALLARILIQSELAAAAAWAAWHAWLLLFAAVVKTAPAVVVGWCLLGPVHYIVIVAIWVCIFFPSRALAGRCWPMLRGA